jgi:uncharacterized lipoprotein YddW (UPF0748 family)
LNFAENFELPISVKFLAVQARHKKENQIRVRAAWLEKENIRLRVELLDARQQIQDLNVTKLPCP